MGKLDTTLTEGKFPTSVDEAKGSAGCKGYYDYWGEFDCLYDTILLCEECKYGMGRKDPEAKCNTE